MKKLSLQKEAELFGKEKIYKILLRTAPPVMLAQLIQALYNIVDSFFVGHYSNDGLTALSVIYPLQLIITALAVGTGVGVNTLMSRYYAANKESEANKAGGCGIVVSLFLWMIFSIISVFILRPFAMTSADSPQAIDYAVEYGMICCVGSIFIFVESIFTKIHQAHGNMVIPMIAQVSGAITNIIFDPLLIFGIGFFPELGIKGAAIATVLGQLVAAIIVGIKGFRKSPALSTYPKYIKNIFKLGFPSIFMQALYTVYILALNIILNGFSDQAVTVLGLYYKIQSFFFIPLFGLQTCIVPILSFNYAQGRYQRVKSVFHESLAISAVFMVIGILCFELIPGQLIGLFSEDDLVKQIGTTAFRIIGISFLPACVSLMSPVFFQALGKGVKSVLLSLTRQIFCLIPIFYAFSFIGLDYTWIAFPVAETTTTIIAVILYFLTVRKWKALGHDQEKILNLN